MPKSLPLVSAACFTYSPTDFEPGYKYLMANKGAHSCTDKLPGQEYVVKDGACIRIASRGLVVKKDYTFEMYYGYATTESFNRSVRLMDGRLLEAPQMADSVGPTHIEFEDSFLYDIYTDIPYIESRTGGRYVLEGVCVKEVYAKLGPLGQMDVVHLKGSYQCLVHELRYRTLNTNRACLY